MTIPSDELRFWTETRPPGGQHVGVSYGVWGEHIPTGIKAFADVSRSQYRNRQIVIDMLLGGLTSPEFK